MESKQRLCLVSASLVVRPARGRTNNKGRQQAGKEEGDGGEVEEEVTRHGPRPRRERVGFQEKMG